MTTQEEDYKRSRLKPATNIREVTPRCCGACAYGLYGDGSFLCRRQGGWEGDAGDGHQWFRVCDGFRPVARYDR